MSSMTGARARLRLAPLSARGAQEHHLAESRIRLWAIRTRMYVRIFQDVMCIHTYRVG